MGVHRFEDLDAYKLSRELRDIVIPLTYTQPLVRYGDLCDDLRRATRSAPSNIAEGFGRWHRRDFIRFLRIACSSLNETKSHLGEVKVLNAMANDIRERCEELASRAAAATTAPIKSLGG